MNKLTVEKVKEIYSKLVDDNKELEYIEKACAMSIFEPYFDEEFVKLFDACPTLNPTRFRNVANNPISRAHTISMLDDKVPKYMFINKDDHRKRRWKFLNILTDINNEAQALCIEYRGFPEKYSMIEPEHVKQLINGAIDSDMALTAEEKELLRERSMEHFRINDTDALQVLLDHCPFTLNDIDKIGENNMINEQILHDYREAHPEDGTKMEEAFARVYKITVHKIFREYLTYMESHKDE